jgi:tetratricopeptide (TPR) repeat protein
MEAFEFDPSRAVYEQLAANPGFLSFRHNHPLYLWLGLSRMGSNDPELAWDAFERLRISTEEGGLPVMHVCPLLDARARCAAARGNPAESLAIARKLVDVATEQHEWSYAVRGLRLLAEAALSAGDFVAAAAHIEQALAFLERCEAWTVEWRVHATAAELFTRQGRRQEAEESRRRALSTADRVAATLDDEPALRDSLLNGVAMTLAARVGAA